MVEISDQEYHALREGYALLDRLLKNPKTARKTESAIKEIHPDVVTSDDVAAPYVGEFKEFAKKVEDRWKKEDDAKVDSEFNKAFDRLKESGYTEEGIEKIKKLMVERKIPDPEAAAALFDKQNPAPKKIPSTLMPSSWGVGRVEKDDDSMKQLYSSPEDWSEKEAIKVFQEIAQERGEE